ncbi:tRNA (guanine(9)-N1)-methyltransferase [[Candida] railenensis]|uniref:tRNA (guanine(9)-N1)-methyltransferase n=1 Tax=[Candida] railenensis TaxID=45579 RepID=A0A9P0QVD9_9ASCO|nr:tRNA (guanine(9)-N1)-methyltransferase [[Candida] railenensis]
MTTLNAEPKKNDETNVPVLDAPPAKRQKIDPATINREKIPVPEGMSKNQFKKLQRQKKWEDSKEKYKEIKREKRRAAKIRQREAVAAAIESKDDESYHSAKKKQIPAHQRPTGIQVIMDCEFDELMNNKEIVSMSNQITRSYSAKRHCDYEIPLKISSFNKNLKQRFDKSVSQYVKWQGIEFSENETLVDILPSERENVVYLTADTDEIIETLEEGHTYIIGGIVDKNRHKLLCVNKAKELGLKVGKLPIDKYIEMNGRHVLATSHVYELLCKWYEEGGDWKKAFDIVLPPRKVKKEEEEADKEKSVKGEGSSNEDGEEEVEEEEEEEDDDDEQEREEDEGDKEDKEDEQN